MMAYHHLESSSMATNITRRDMARHGGMMCLLGEEQTSTCETILTPSPIKSDQTLDLTTIHWKDMAKDTTYHKVTINTIQTVGDSTGQTT